MNSNWINVEVDELEEVAINIDYITYIRYTETGCEIGILDKKDPIKSRETYAALIEKLDTTRLWGDSDE